MAPADPNRPTAAPEAPPASATRGTDREEPGAPAPEERRRALVSSFIGNFVEWFDYGAYSYLAVTIGAVFFPGAVEQSTFMAFGLFGVAFLIRPFGAFFWGHWGDRLGRSKTLAWSILLMSGATALIGLLPGHASWGTAAVILLLVLRLVQGFSAAGEYAGASALLTEYAPKNRRGLYASVVPASTSTGLLLGSLFATALYGLLDDAAMSAWGWRVPFLAAAPLGVVGLVIRRRIGDSPAFVEHTTAQMAVVQRGQKPVPPLVQLFRAPKELVQGLGIVLLNAVGFYVVLTYMPAYLSESLGYDPAASQFATTLTLVVYIALVFLTGRIADRLGRRTTLLLAAGCFAVLGIPGFLLMGLGHYWLSVLALVLMGAFLSLNDGAMPSAVSELYPTGIRFTGFALVFNVGNALFGGPMSALNTWLIGQTGNTLWPAFLLVGAAVLSFAAVAWSKDRAEDPIADNSASG